MAPAAPVAAFAAMQDRSIAPAAPAAASGTNAGAFCGSGNNCYSVQERSKSVSRASSPAAPVASIVTWNKYQDRSGAGFGTWNKSRIVLGQDLRL